MVFFIQTWELAGLGPLIIGDLQSSALSAGAFFTEGGMGARRGKSQHGCLPSGIVCPDWGGRLACGKPGEWARVDPVSARVGWGCSPVKPS